MKRRSFLSGFGAAVGAVLFFPKKPIHAELSEYEQKFKDNSLPPQNLIGYSGIYNLSGISFAAFPMSGKVSDETAAELRRKGIWK